LYDTVPLDLSLRSLHDALPIFRSDPEHLNTLVSGRHAEWSQFAKLVRVLKRWNSDHGEHMKSLLVEVLALDHLPVADRPGALARDRKSTRLNSSHQIISYAVFC